MLFPFHTKEVVSTLFVFIFLSSFAVYKELTKPTLLDEDKSKTIPRNEYGISKLAAEKYIKVYHQETEPVIKYYQKKGILQTINGIGKTEEVYHRVKTVVKKLK